MSFWTPQSIAATVRGTWLAQPPLSLGGPLSGVSIDSRTIAPGQLFIAIAGDRFDGHSFAQAAVDRGSPLVIVESASKLPAGSLEAISKRAGVLAVKSTGEALLALGAAYRATLRDTTVIAVGGSNGKTTTTRMIEAILTQRFRGTASPKSFNNAVGVPLTILAAKPTDRFLLCEVGTNAPGEIAQLAPVVRPDIAVITSIGREHLEGLGDLKGVALEESAIFAGLAPGGVAIINAEAPFIGELAAQKVKAVERASLQRFGSAANSELRIDSIEQGPSGVRFLAGGRPFAIPMLGRHNAFNAAAAIAVGRRLGVDDDAIRAGLAAVKAPEMRMQPMTVAGATIVNDAYNANPDSMLAALAAFGEIAGNAPRRVVVLGDMRELGAATTDSHAEIARAALASRAELIVLVGPSFASVAKPDRARVHAFAALTPETFATIAALLRPGDAVLLKGSRGTAMERLIPALRERATPTPTPTPTPAPTPADIKPHSPAEAR